MVAGLAKGLPILYNSVIQKIEYSENRVRVSTSNQSFKGSLPRPLATPATNSPPKGYFIQLPKH